jgi:DNA invertase Pin-like site-specific DNA recombinase
MKQKIFAYARVSTKDQNVDRQIDELQKYVNDERDLYIDHASGKNFDRPEYDRLKHNARDGDIIYIKSLDRFGRNKDQIKDELEYYRKNNIIVKILDIPTTLMDFAGFGDMQAAIMDMINNVLIEVLGTIAEQERKTIKQRQKEGIDAAHRRGKHLGRPNAKYPDNWDVTIKQWHDGKIQAVQAMRELNLPKATFYKLVKSKTTLTK